VPRCELCDLASSTAWQVVGTTDRLSVVRVLDAPAFPAFYRVVWQGHVPEWTDLDRTDRAHCLDAVAVVESALRHALTPRKINLASLGNMVPHLHWHVIARFEWDTHFPQPIWGTPQRAPDETRLAPVRAALDDVDAQVRRGLAL
jgi:diadenosine tetraphosphate (Ap4A) HIT family hydrolase